MGRTSDAKERLLQSGATLFHTKGYQAVGVQEICTHANVKKGSFYYFFSTKRDLAVTILEEQTNQFQPFLKKTLATAGSRADKVEALFEAASNMQAAYLAETQQIPGCPVGNLALEMSPHDNTLRQAVGESLSRFSRTIQTALLEADPNTPTASQQAEAVVALLEGALMLAKNQNDPERIRQMIPFARQLVQ
ncbi:TetR/AcrR family transcriptional regulator [Magnetococcus sp. PR-3]|uniref:TetR/AcrR family transcriptional regulator n=1 Tax=Magnetococcus sp. PR-3 TaxID=3120355 RepID=UPI002FCE4F65